MKTEILEEALSSELQPAVPPLETEFLKGLKRRPKLLPSKLFYDEAGSRLFEQICELDEYYLTRTETKILRNKMAEIARLCGWGCLLVELGSGNSSKTRLLLDHLDAPAAYVPIDISRSHLARAAQALKEDYFPLQILPVCADYHHALSLPAPVKTPERTVIFFPGSTIGNFEPWQAAAFLRRVASWCEAGDGFLVGVDLQKDRQILEPAYNDAKGITAAFNLNLLRRANDELGANFDLEQFYHRAVFDEAHGRIEMRLVSRCHQWVRISGEEIHFRRGEFITTEYSYKYRIEAFHRLCSTAGWDIECTWTDENQWFSICSLKRQRSLPANQPGLVSNQF